MCSFGGDLQDKCELLSEYHQLIADIDTKNSGEFSHPDRMEEWRVTQIAKCLVKKLSGNHEVNDDTLTYCESQVNFDRDVGTLDKKTDEVDSSTGKFSCTESEIEFVGGTYVIDKKHYPKLVAHYVKSPTFVPALTLTDGDDPFDFCSTISN